jgi:hypothetical protein
VNVYSWYDLPSKEQRAVLRLARRGREHPDRKVAGFAREWAEDTLRNDGSIFSIVFGTVLGLLMHSDAGVGVSLVDRRRAKRILRAAEAPRRGRRSAR